MTPHESLIPIEYLHECLEHRDGVLYWKARPRSHFQSHKAQVISSRVSGRAVQTLDSKGYVVFMLSYNGRKLRLAAHRVIWLFHTGNWPTNVIDHINRVKTDNRPSNLRDVTHDENMRNNGNPNGTGLRGAYPSKGNKFKSQIPINGQVKYLGVFETAIEAHESYMTALRSRLEGKTP